MRSLASQLKALAAAILLFPIGASGQENGFSPGDLVALSSKLRVGDLIHIDRETAKQSLIACCSFYSDFGFAPSDDSTIYALSGISVVEVDTATGDTSVVSSGGYIVRPRGIAVGRGNRICVLDEPVHGTEARIIEISRSSGEQAILSEGGLLDGRENRDLEILPSGDLVVLQSFGWMEELVILRVDSETGLGRQLIDPGLPGSPGFVDLLDFTGLGVDQTTGDIFASSDGDYSIRVLKIDGVTEEASIAGFVTILEPFPGCPYGERLRETDFAVGTDGEQWFGMWIGGFGEECGLSGVFAFDERPLVDDLGQPFAPIPFGRFNIASELQVVPTPFLVPLDIKPGSDSNPINPSGRGILPVAILGSETFDATDVDVTTLALGPDAAAPAHDLTKPGLFEDHLRDVNDDGFTDLVSHYRTQETGISRDDAEACITGDLLDSTPFEGCNTVEVLAPKGGKP
jgi:hypothetical protein